MYMCLIYIYVYIYRVRKRSFDSLKCLHQSFLNSSEWLSVNFTTHFIYQVFR